MTSRWGHSFAARQLGTFPFCRQLGTVLGNPAGKPAVRQRLSPMTSRLSLSPMTTLGRLSLSPMSTQRLGGYCLFYTSYAADERSSLGPRGRRRLYKKKPDQQKQLYNST